jgi:hypothetical protein
VPGASPKTDIGSFEILSELQKRDIYIYWQQIPEYHHNGDNFDYKIVVDDESGEAQYVQYLSLFLNWKFSPLIQFEGQI